MKYSTIYQKQKSSNVYTKIDDLPLDENPTYLEEGINGICTGGSALLMFLEISNGLFPMIW